VKTKDADSLQKFLTILIFVLQAIQPVTIMGLLCRNYRCSPDFPGVR